MTVVVTEVCSESKRQLQQLKKDFEQFLISKEHQLSPTASLLCTDMSTVPKVVRFNIANVPESISAALSESWAVGSADVYLTLRCFDENQRNAAIESTLAEATNLAQKGISEALEYADSIIGEDTSFEQAKYMVVSKLLTFTKSQNTKNLNLIQYFWNLRQEGILTEIAKQQYTLSDEATVEVGKRLAELFYHQLGRFSEAETILRKCYDIASQQSALLELSMLVCNEICGVFFASEQYQEAESFGMWILGTFKDACCLPEHCWTTLLYISYSMNEISKNNEAKEIIESWRKRDVTGESKFGEMMRLLTCRIGVSSTEVEGCLLRAQRIGVSHFPTSPFTALALFHLGLSAIADARGEQYLRQAEAIYEAASPQSAQAAMNLTKLGDLSKASMRLSEAEKYYRQAQSIYETASSKSYNEAVNFIKLGDLCFSMKRQDEVEECCRQVKSIIQVASPEQRSRLEDVAGKLEALGTRSASPPVQEERKQPPAGLEKPVEAIQSAVQEERKQQPAGSKQPVQATQPAAEEEKNQPSAGPKQQVEAIQLAEQEEVKQSPAILKQPVEVAQPAAQEERKQPLIKPGKLLHAGKLVQQQKLGSHLPDRHNQVERFNQQHRKKASSHQPDRSNKQKPSSQLYKRREEAISGSDPNSEMTAVRQKNSQNEGMAAEPQHLAATVPLTFMQKCPKCSRSTPESSQTCVHCGEKLSWTCSRCTLINKESARKCEVCANTREDLPKPARQEDSKSCKPEYWKCQLCGYAANIAADKVCYKCKGSKNWERAGMWICFDCNAQNDTSAHTCADCGARRLAEGSKDLDTWECSRCRNNNPSRRTHCGECYRPRVENSQENNKQSRTRESEQLSKAPQVKERPQESEASEGKEWQCKECGFANRESRRYCSSCYSSKSVEGAKEPEGWTCTNCKVKNRGSDQLCVGCSFREVPKKLIASDNYWTCASCHTRNYKGNDKCYRCKVQKD